MVQPAYEVPAMPEYGFGMRLRGLTMERARGRVGEALAAEGFCVLSEIDVRATLKRKLGVDVSPYLILGVCHAALAYRALLTEPYSGLFITTNVALWEDGREIFVTIANPEATLGLVADPRLEPVASEAESRLRGALERLGAA